MLHDNEAASTNDAPRSSEVIPFTYEGQQFRVFTVNNEPMFAAKDVCDVIGIKNYRDAVSRLDDDEKGVGKADTLGGTQTIATVTESGLYTLCIRSNSPTAKPFRRWVTHEVLPSIRRHGMYATAQTVELMLGNPDAFIKTLQAYKEEQAKRKQAEATIEENRPKVLFADAVTTSKRSILVSELAKYLTQNGYEIGQNRLFAKLRAEGYLCSARGERWNLPMQKAVEQGLFDLKTTAITHSDGRVTTSRTVKVTGKGQIYFLNKFLGGVK